VSYIDTYIHLYTPVHFPTITLTALFAWGARGQNRCRSKAVTVHATVGLHRINTASMTSLFATDENEIKYQTKKELKSFKPRKLWWTCRITYVACATVAIRLSTLRMYTAQVVKHRADTFCLDRLISQQSNCVLSCKYCTLHICCMNKKLREPNIGFPRQANQKPHHYTCFSGDSRR
jgi:hypothetical protein